MTRKDLLALFEQQGLPPTRNNSEVYSVDIFDIFCKEEFAEVQVGSSGYHLLSIKVPYEELRVEEYGYVLVMGNDMLRLQLDKRDF